MELPRFPTNPTSKLLFLSLNFTGGLQTVQIVSIKNREIDH